MNPPKRAIRFLRWFCREDYVEEIEGDLIEIFDRSNTTSPHLAPWKFTWNVIRHLRPEFVKPFKSFKPNPYGMYKSYFKIGWRNLLKEKGYAFINVGGLALGLTCFMIILLYVQHEFSHNRFYPNADQLYRVYQKQAGNMFMGTEFFAVTPAPLAAAMREEFPEVVNATTVEASSGLLGNHDQFFWETGLAGDEEFFNVFTVPFVEGNPKAALSDPKSIVLTRSLAEKLFGDQNPVGQPLNYQEKDGYHVTAVIEDPPLSSSLQYTFVINIQYNDFFVKSQNPEGWASNSFHTFFVLAENSDAASVEARFPGLLKKYDQADGPQNLSKNEYFVQPISEMYFQQDINVDIGIKGNRTAVYLFSVVALIVLILACVNYMNLALARSIKRAREVGLRKVVGALRSQLVTQFLGESLLIAFFSLVLGVGLTYLFLPYFAQMMERPIEIDIISTPWILPSLLSLVLGVGFFSGSYPALVMSSLRPIEVLKVKTSTKVSGFSLQRLLIVVQFAASITLVIGSITIYRQLHYIQEKDTGYRTDNVIIIPLKDRALRDKFPLLQAEWSQQAGIVSTALSSHLPINITSSSIINISPDAPEAKLQMYQCVVTQDFLDVFGITLAAGRNFSAALSGEGEQSFILNETAAQALGWTPEEAIGKPLYNGHVIGVVHDFHMHSMHLPIQPLAIRYAENRGRYISVKAQHDRVTDVIAILEKTIKRESAYPFEYTFLEDDFDRLYASEMKLGDIFGFFTLVAIVVASLGLFGLAAFLSGQRTKEIGVRKVMGASARSIVVLIAKDYVRLVIIAFVISIPLGWYAMHTWLQNFAYRIDLTWWTFALAGGLALAVANLSIGYQSVRAARMDPVRSLRSE